MDLIATTSVGAGGAASVSFTAIPGTYTDLIIISSARTTSATDYLIAQLNGTTSGYSSMYLGGTGTGVTNSTITTSGLILGDVSGGATANTFQVSTMTIPNYTSATTKECIANGGFENNASAANQSVTNSKSSVTAAITTILIKGISFNLAQHSTFSLYGVLKGSGGATV
jgi:hypothetical protein